VARLRRGMGLKFKAHEKHSDTKIHTIGPGTVVTPEHIMRDTQVGARDPDGANDTIQLGRSYAEECNIGDACKYINIIIQAGPKLVSDPVLATSLGWIEWAFCCHKTTDASPTNTNVGISTLGDICTKYFREECVYTGAMPIGNLQCNVQTIMIKIPKKKVVLRAGDQWVLYIRARTVSSTETGTATFKVITSCNYINYH